MRNDYLGTLSEKIGKKVKVAGWVHKFVNMGKLKFIILRDRTGSAQITAKKGVVSDELIEKIDVGKEWVVMVEGEVKENKIAPGGIEIIPEKFEVLNKVERKLPIDPTGEVKAELDTRLKYRYLDTRRAEVNAIFEIKSWIINSFRKTLLDMGYVEIHPPTILGAATEGGTEVFEVRYFENKGYLAQSPQLYKQLAIVGGMDKVFMTGPVFRAEKHNTPTHLNEIIMMDVELGFADHHDAMDVLEKLITKMVDVPELLLEKVGVEKEKVEKVNRITYDEAVEFLNRKGFSLKWGDDFNREMEAKLCEEFGTLFVYDYPTETRAFYSMPHEDDPKKCKSFDLLFKGLEISSGAQRIHKADMLENALKARGLNPAEFDFYVEAFRYGAPPHAGFGIGLERVVMKVCGLSNIREAMLYPRDRTRLYP